MKKAFFYLAYCAILLFVTVVAVEGLARIIHPDDTYNVNDLSEFDYDAVLGWKGIPGYDGRSPLSGAHVKINQRGYRDKEWEQAIKRADRQHLTKILFLGDSEVYGYEIEAYERITEQLEDLYRRNGREVVTFNAGIPAFGTGQEFRAFEILYPLINPDIVLLKYTSNDIGDSALPYCWANPKRRVYRPFYDLEGRLILNREVPKRFSLKIRGTFLEHFRMKYMVDRIQSLIDDIRYANMGISENRRIVVKNQEQNPRTGFRRHVWDMGCVTTHPGFRDIYEKNKVRNFNLWKRLASICKRDGKKFVILTTFSGHSDPGNPHREIIEFLKNNGIDFINVAVGNRHGLWGYVNYDGHPNFLSNYIAAVNVFDALEKQHVAIDYAKTERYQALSSEIDFSKGRFHKYLFGANWDRVIEHSDARGGAGRWLKGAARFILKNDPKSRGWEIQIAGFSESKKNVITIEENESKARESISINKSGPFLARFQFADQDPHELLFCQIRPEKPLFVHSIRLIDSSH